MSYDKQYTLAQKYTYSSNDYNTGVQIVICTLQMLSGTLSVNEI